MPQPLQIQDTKDNYSFSFALKCLASFSLAAVVAAAVTSTGLATHTLAMTSLVALTVVSSNLLAIIVPLIVGILLLSGGCILPFFFCSSDRTAYVPLPQAQVHSGWGGPVVLGNGPHHSHHHQHQPTFFQPQVPPFPHPGGGPVYVPPTPTYGGHPGGTMHTHR